jgi:hypothetical protein
LTNLVLLQSQVWEIVTVTGTGDIRLSGIAEPGPYSTFSSAYPDFLEVEVFYSIVDTVNSQWERGIGRFKDRPQQGQLFRDAVLASSNANDLVNFAGNPCNVTTLSSDDSPYIEFFGGSTNPSFDNGAAIVNAISQGYPVRFGPGTYYVSGNLVISSNAVLIGTEGLTTVKRLSQAAYQSWIDFTCPIVYLNGIIFDYNLSITEGALGIVVDSTVTQSFISNCQFLNNKSPLNPTGIQEQDYSTQGCGLLYQSTAASSTVVSHTISGCIFTNNNSDGLQIFNVNDVSVLDCISYNNGYNGIAVYGDLANESPNNRIAIRGCSTYGNGNGIFVDFVYNGTLQEYSNVAPATVGAQIISNKSHNNRGYGIYIGTLKNGLVQGNLCHDNNQNPTQGAAEILGDCAQFTEFSENILYGAESSYGIDAAGGYYCAFNNNIITGSFSYGLNIGGSNGNSANGNRISMFTVAGIDIQQIENGGNNNPFGVLASNIILSNNVIDYSSGGNAISLSDNPNQTLILNNQFINPSDPSGLSAVFDASSSAAYSGNSINGLKTPSISVTSRVETHNIHHTTAATR